MPARASALTERLREAQAATALDVSLGQPDYSIDQTGWLVPPRAPARLAQIADHLKRHAHILSNAEAALIITVPILLRQRGTP